MIPCLMICFNRLEYTKQALRSLFHSDCGEIFIIDNNSTDGTQEYLLEMKRNPERTTLIFNKENNGIAGAMNQFLELTKGYNYVAKVDNDTLVPDNWSSELLKKMLNCNIDIIQAKHNCDPAVTKGKTFDEWMKTLRQDKKDPSIYYHHFVGGSGIVFKRNIVDAVPFTDWKLYGWNVFQKSRPELKKAFCTDVEITLLDGSGDYSKYPEYYKQTKRL